MPCTGGINYVRLIPSVQQPSVYDCMVRDNRARLANTFAAGSERPPKEDAPAEFSRSHEHLLELPGRSSRMLKQT